MKTREEIEGRIRFLLVQELDRRVAEASRRLPCLCTHNHQQPLDTRRQVYGEPNDSFNRVSSEPGVPVGQTMGLCMLGADKPEEWNCTICEDPIDAQKCPLFTPLKTKEHIESTFREEVNDMPWVQEHMPEMYGLLWTLDTGVVALRLPWWKRVWYWTLRIRVEPGASNGTIMGLLVAPDSPCPYPKEDK